MSYFDDDDDDFEDYAFGGAVGGLSQDSLMSPFGGQAQSVKNEVDQSQDRTDNNPLLSQQSLLSQLSSSNRDPLSQQPRMSSIPTDPNDDYFLCENCGSTESYIDETTGALTCQICFTQSQTFVAKSQQEFDYEDAMGMAARSRDGRLLQSSSQGSVRSGQSHLSQDLAEAEKKRRRGGRPRKADEEYDTTTELPTLEECLRAFVTVLRVSTKLVCMNLLPLPMTVVNDNTLETSNETTLSPSIDQFMYSDKNDGDDDQQEAVRQRKAMYERVLSVVKALWKAYLESWQEGTDYYATRYPQLRCSMRDAFLPPLTLDKLHKVLAARAAVNLRKQVENESNDDDNDNDEEDDKDVNVKTTDSDSDEISTRSRVPNQNGDPTLKDDRTSLKRKKQRKRIAQYIRNTGSDSASSSDSSSSSSSDSGNVAKPSKMEASVGPRSTDDIFLGEDIDLQLDNDDGFHEESDLSDIDDDNNVRSKTRGGLLNSNQLSRFTGIVQLHCLRRQEGNRRSLNSNVRRTDAALLLSPSMKMILGMICIAAAPYGVTASLLVEWVKSGAIPLLDAYNSVVLKEEKNEDTRRKLNAVASFFSLPSYPSVRQIDRVVRCLHVACGYRPPSVKLAPRKRKRKDDDDDDKSVVSNQNQAATELKTKCLFRAGRLIRPSNISNVTAQLVLNLNLKSCQTILNYSLSMMGLLASSRYVSGTNEPVKQQQETWLPPSLPSARPDKLDDTTDVLAVIVVACKLMLDWENDVESFGQPYTKRRRYIDDDGDGNNMKQDSFVPWNQRAFSQLTNGSLEIDYLDFLERGSVVNVESSTLHRTAALFSDKRDVKKQADRRRLGCDDEARVMSFSDNLYTKPQDDTERSRNILSMNQITYRKLVCDDLTGISPIPLPDGQLIEYIAAMSGGGIHRILKTLVRLEDELVTYLTAKRKRRSRGRHGRRKSNCK